MVKKLKAMANKSRGDNQLAGAIKESAHEIWLAGLGAFAKAQEEGQKVLQGAGARRQFDAAAHDEGHRR